MGICEFCGREYPEEEIKKRGRKQRFCKNIDCMRKRTIRNTQKYRSANHITKHRKPPKQPVYHQCIVCGKDFIRTPKSLHIYCSLECKIQYQKRTFTCINCKSEIPLQKPERRRSMDQYCNKCIDILVQPLYHETIRDIHEKYHISKQRIIRSLNKISSKCPDCQTRTLLTENHQCPKKPSDTMNRIQSLKQQPKITKTECCKMLCCKPTRDLAMTLLKDKMTPVELDYILTVIKILEKNILQKTGMTPQIPPRSMIGVVISILWKNTLKYTQEKISALVGITPVTFRTYYHRVYQMHILTFNILEIQSKITHEYMGEEQKRIDEENKKREIRQTPIDQIIQEKNDTYQSQIDQKLKEIDEQQKSEHKLKQKEQDEIYQLLQERMRQEREKQQKIREEIQRKKQLELEKKRKERQIEIKIKREEHRLSMESKRQQQIEDAKSYLRRRGIIP